MRFLSLSFVALTMLVVGVEQIPAQKNDEAELKKRLADVRKQMDEMRKKMEMLKAEQEKLAAEQGKLAAEGDRLATELFIKFEMHADRGAIQRLDVVNGTPQGFVLGRFKAIVQDPLARSLFPSLVIDPIFRADECTVRLRKDTRIMFSDKQQAQPSHLQAGQWVRLRVKFADLGKSKAEAEEIIIDKTARQIVGTTSVGDLAKKVDFAKEEAVLFQWLGEKDDKLVFVVGADKEGPIVDFRFYPDLARLLHRASLKLDRNGRDDDDEPTTRHSRIYVIAKDVRVTGLSDPLPRNPNLRQAETLVKTFGPPIWQFSHRGRRFTNAGELARALMIGGAIIRPPLFEGQKEPDLLQPNQGKQGFTMDLVRPTLVAEPRQGRTVLVDPDTEVTFSDKQKAKLSDLKPGQYVQIRTRIVDHSELLVVEADGIVIERALRRIYERKDPSDTVKQVDFTKEHVLLFRIKSQLADDELMLAVTRDEKGPHVDITFQPAISRGRLGMSPERVGSGILFRVYAIAKDARVTGDVQGTRITSAEELAKVLQANP